MLQVRVLRQWVSVHMQGITRNGIRLTVDESRLRIRGPLVGRLELPLKDITSCETGRTTASGWLSMLRHAVCVNHGVAGVPNPIYVITSDPARLLKFLGEVGVRTFDRAGVCERKILPIQILAAVNWSIVLLWLGVTSFAVLLFLYILLRFMCQ